MTYINGNRRISPLDINKNVTIGGAFPLNEVNMFKGTQTVKEQVKRVPRALPQLKFPDINNLKDLKDLSLDDFVLEGYDPHPAIKAKMAI